MAYIPTDLVSHLLTKMSIIIFLPIQFIPNNKQNEALIARIKDLEKQLRKEQDNHTLALADRDREMADLREVMAEQQREYEDLMSIKLTLDLEIEAYRKLLEGEETRYVVSTRNNPWYCVVKRSGCPVAVLPLKYVHCQC